MQVFQTIYRNARFTYCGACHKLFVGVPSDEWMHECGGSERRPPITVAQTVVATGPVETEKSLVAEIAELRKVPKGDAELLDALSESDSIRQMQSEQIEKQGKQIEELVTQLAMTMSREELQGYKDNLP